MAMTDTLMSLVKGYITPEFIQKASSFLGESPERTSSGFMSAIPTLLGGLFNKGSTFDGAQKLMNLVQDGNYESGVSPNYLDHFKGGKTTEHFIQNGQDAINGIFGNSVTNITDNFSSQVGIKRSTCSQLLSLLAPIVMGTLGSQVRKYGLNASSLMSFLKEQKALLSNFIPEEGVRNQEVDRKIEHLRDTNNEYQKIAPVEHEKPRSSKKWIPLGLAAALAFGGFMFMKDRNTSEVIQTTEVTREQAGTADTSAIPPEAPSRQVIEEESSGPPLIIEQVTTFLESGNDSELPKRFTFDRVNFLSRSIQLTPQSIPTIDGIAEALKKHPNTLIRLDGFTDNTGTPDANEKLSLARAEAIKQGLIERGIDANRISTVGRGDTQPLDSNETEEGRAANRRIELVVLQR